jgi:hypothetical protein
MVSRYLGIKATKSSLGASLPPKKRKKPPSPSKGRPLLLSENRGLTISDPENLALYRKPDHPPSPRKLRGLGGFQLDAQASNVDGLIVQFLGQIS